MRRIPFQVALVAGTALSLAGSADASTFVVTPANPDAAPTFCLSGLSCTLREAITDANDEGTHAGPDTIQLPPATYSIAPLDALPTITSDITIEGTGGAKVTTITGADTAAASSPQGGVFTVDTAPGKLTLRGVTVSGNRLTGTAANGAGAIAASSGATVVLERSVLRGNRTEAASSNTGAGAVAGSNGAKLTLTDSAVEANIYAGTSTGGVGATAAGVVSDSGGPTQIARSSISRNRGDLPSGPNVSVAGGLNLNTTGSLTLTDSTVSQNSVTTGAPFRTGGMIINGPGFAGSTITNLTLTDNVIVGSGSLAAGNLVIGTFAAAIRNSIIAGGGPQNCVLLGGATIASGGGNIEDANACTFTQPTDAFDTPPKLAALQFTGGLGLSQEPLPTSPALNRGVTALCSALDQTGLARPQGGGCDSGAVETAAPPANTALPSISGTASGGQTLTCNPGTFTEGPTLSFAWLSDGALVGSGATFTIGAAQLDTAIQCRVTATNFKGSTVATSAAVVPPKPVVPPPPTPPAAPVNTVRPTFSGTLRTGQKLTCAQGTFSNATSFALTWLRNGTRVASGATYTLATGDAGKAIQCQVTATGPGGSVVAESAPGVAAKACIVPTLVGKTVAAAKKALTKANCATGKTTSRKSTKKAGTVIATSPARGKNVAAQTKVALTVAKK
jgi:hypothetical protein